MGEGLDIKLILYFIAFFYFSGNISRSIALQKSFQYAFATDAVWAKSCYVLFHKTKLTTIILQVIDKKPGVSSHFLWVYAEQTGKIDINMELSFPFLYKDIYIQMK